MKLRTVGLIVVTIFVSCIVQANSDLLNQINAAYYQLPDQEVVGFTSTFQHADILKFAQRLMKEDDVKGKTLAENLSQFYLKIHVSSEDGFRMFTSPMPLISDQFIATGVSDIIYRSERSLAAILDTWIQFVLRPVLPLRNDNGELIRYEITENKKQWRIEQADQGIQTSLVINKADYRVLRITSFAEGHKIVIQPSFEVTSDGWLFLGYDSDMDGGEAKLSVRIQHQKMQNAYVPTEISLTVQHNEKLIGQETYSLNSELIMKSSKGRI